MQLKAELCEPRLRQTTVDHFERRHLLRDEEHGLVFGERLRNEVGNRLRLACAGRAFEHEVVPARDGEDGAELTRIGVGHLRRPLGRELAVQFGGADLLRQRADRGAAAQYELPDEAVRAEGFGVRLHVLEHDELLEGEEGEVNLALDLPARLRGDGAGRLCEELLQVVVVGQVRQVGEVRQRDGERAAEVFDEGGVDDGVVVGGADGVAGACALARERDGQEDQRGSQDLLGAFRLLVVEHPEREEERVDALLFKAHARLVGDAAQRAVEVFGRERRLQQVVPVPLFEPRSVVGHEVGGRRRFGRLVFREAVRRRGLAGRRRRSVRRLLRLGGAEAHLPAFQVEAAEDLGRHLFDDGDGRGPRRLEVQRAVALAHVEQLALPVADGRRDPRLLGARRLRGPGGYSCCFRLHQSPLTPESRDGSRRRHRHHPS
jgi:hypothetical protein